MEKMKKTIAAFLLLATGLLLAGCNTMHGLGKDIEKVGDKIQEKSSK